MLIKEEMYGSVYEEKLIKDNLGLVYFVADKYRRANFYDDLVCECKMALYNGLRSYVSDKGKLSTHLVNVMYHAIDDFLAHEHSQHCFNSDNKKLKDAIKERVEAGMSVEEISEDLGITQKRVISILEYGISKSLDANIDGTDDLTGLDTICDRVSISDRKLVEGIKADINRIIEFYSTIEPISAKIYKLCINIETGKKRSYAEVGKIMNMSGEAVRKRKNNFLDMLYKDTNFMACFEELSRIVRESYVA